MQKQNKGYLQFEYFRRRRKFYIKNVFASKIFGEDRVNYIFSKMKILNVNIQNFY